MSSSLTYVLDFASIRDAAERKSDRLCFQIPKDFNWARTVLTGYPPKRNRKAIPYIFSDGLGLQHRLSSRTRLEGYLDGPHFPAMVLPRRKQGAELFGASKALLRYRVGALTWSCSAELLGLPCR